MSHIYQYLFQNDKISRFELLLMPFLACHFMEKETEMLMTIPTLGLNDFEKNSNYHYSQFH